MVKEGTLIGILAIVAVISVIGLVASMTAVSTMGDFKAVLVKVNKSVTPGGLAWCSDTDGGIVFDTRGTVSGKNSSGGTYSFTDYCTGPYPYIHLREYYCAFANTSSPEPSSIVYECPYGCSAGACEEAPAPFCEDSDGGIVVNVSGWVNASNGIFVDTCIGNSTNTTLLESRCRNSQGEYLQINCLDYSYSACSDGRCHNETVER